MSLRAMQQSVDRSALNYVAPLVPQPGHCGTLHKNCVSYSSTCFRNSAPCSLWQGEEDAFSEIEKTITHPSFAPRKKEDIRNFYNNIVAADTNTIYRLSIRLYDEEQKNKILKHIDGRYWYILDKIHFFRLNCIDILNII